MVGLEASEEIGEFVAREVPREWLSDFVSTARAQSSWPYNRTRRHSTLGYLSPAQFEAMTMTNNNQDND